MNVIIIYIHYLILFPYLKKTSRSRSLQLFNGSEININVHMKAAIITVGDEILIGQIIDSNSAWMAKELNQVGAEILKIISIGDGEQEIIDTISEALKLGDIVLMTGGLGPTKDDITKKAIAKYFNVGMQFDQGTYDRILQLFARWGRKATPEHREQCYMPDNAELLFNKMGTAPGMWFKKDAKVLISMPGVPYEMKYLMKEEILPRLQKTFPGQTIAHRTILTVGEGESRIANRIQDFETALPAHIKLAFLPDLGKVRLRLTGRGGSTEQLKEELDEKAESLKSLLPELVFGEGTTSLPQAIGQILMEQGKTLASAESCTGGYLGHLLTSTPGSSAYYHGGLIAYSNDIKINQLKVNLDTINQHGAVSEQTVKEMVKGTLDLLKTDIAVAISGIAGPGGGSPEKPVGTIWIAVGDQNLTETFLLKAGKDRLKNIEYSATYALDRIRRFLLSTNKK